MSVLDLRRCRCLFDRNTRLSRPRQTQVQPHPNTKRLFAHYPPVMSSAPGLVSVSILPQLVAPASLRHHTAIIIDQLRASTTICAALQNGAVAVHPFLEPDDAQAFKHRQPRGTCLTGGERHGQLIPGFDLDNSPAAYTTDRVADRHIAFTTTNGTKAALLAQEADSVLVACLGNRLAIIEHLAESSDPIHIICAGTRERVTLEDILAAGAIADGLLARGHPLHAPDARADDDTAHLGHVLWQSASAKPDGILHALLRSRGGRNLARIGLDADIAHCAQLDIYSVVPTFNRELNAFVAAPSREP